MAWTGDYMSVINEIMLEDPLDDVLGDAVVRLPWWHRIMSVGSVKEFHGKWLKGVIQTVFNYNASPREELDDVILPLPDKFEELRFTIFQVMSSIGWTTEEAEDAVKTDRDAVLNLVQRKVARAPIDMQRKINYFLATDGTGRLARVSAYNAGTRVVTTDSTKANFAWDLLQWVYNGMLVDVFTVADITGTAAWTPKALQVRVDQVSKVAGTFRITVVDGNPNSVIDAAPANDDFVFVNNSVKLDTSDKFVRFKVPYGKMNIIDDGSSDGNEFHDGSVVGANGCWAGKTYCNLDRLLYDQLKCAMWRANNWKTGGTAGTPEIASVADIQEVIRLQDEEGESGSLITALYMNGKTRNWLGRTADAERNTFTPSQSGRITPGIFTEQMRTGTGRLVDIVPMSGMPDGHIDFVAEQDYVRLTKVPVGWHNLDGKRVFTPPTARNLTHESWMRTRFNTIGLSWGSAHMEDIDISA
ncbi:MAG TPA: hypothetical protein VMX94_07145 [Armatimonadota bacterium]|nr:hypothetical protein [Armatimonadota bacterium]